MLLENDIQACIADIKEIFQDDQGKSNRFDLRPESVQMVLVDMRFNLGFQGFRKLRLFNTAAKN